MNKSFCFSQNTPQQLEKNIIKNSNLNKSFSISQNTPHQIEKN